MELVVSQELSLHMNRAMAYIPNVVFNLLPYHLLSYGLLLGTEVYQSFVMTRLCFKYMPRPQFTQLQKRVFPVYFAIQTALAATTIFTFPTKGVLSVLGSGWNQSMPLATILVMSGLNILVYGPRTSEIMMDRVRQDTRDGKKVEGEVSTSKAMRAMNRAFSRAHAMAIHLNAIAMVATVWYGFSLASRLTIEA